jgi:hypothetical protein
LSLIANSQLRESPVSISYGSEDSGREPEL